MRQPLASALASRECRSRDSPVQGKSFGPTTAMPAAVKTWLSEVVSLSISMRQQYVWAFRHGSNYLFYMGKSLADFKLELYS